MEFFSTNYLTVRNDHILPRIKYGVSRNKIQYWSLKDVFSKKLISLQKLSGKSVEIELPVEDYFKAIQCDSELFLNKSYIQHSDYLSQSDYISKTWSFVTLYYFVFFSATCLFRLLDRGFIFLSNENTKSLEDYSAAVNSEAIALGAGNYFFILKGINEYGNAVVTLSSKGDSIHKSSWLLLENILKDFEPRSNSEEKTVLNLLLEYFNTFKTEFPSILRNKLNYHGESSLFDIEGSLPKVPIPKLDSEFLKKMAGNNFGKNDVQNQMECVGYLGSYIFSFSQKLYKEYLQRSNFGKDFNNDRMKYLKSRESA